MCRLTIAAILAAFFAGAVFLVSCGSSNNMVQPASRLNIPWPPAENAIKNSSDDTLVLSGQDFSSKGGDSYNIGFPFSLQLYGGGDLPWAIYSMGGFNQDIAFSRFTIDCEFRPREPDDGSMLYLGFANYTMGTWEWFNLGDGVFTQPVPDDTDYISPLGSIHFVVVFLGPDMAYSNVLSMEIERTGDTSISPPLGLTADPALDEITLTWQEVPTAEGYHIYRDVQNDFLAPLKLTDGAPLTEATFTDETVERGVMYYYKASSIRDVVESDLSPFVDTFAPDYIRPMPTPLGGYSQGLEDYTVLWSWSGQFPNYFRVYYSEEPDFNLDLPTEFVEVTGNLHEADLDLSNMGNTIYWRVVSYQSSKHGLMTDDMLGETTTIWEWVSPEELGDGTAPMAWVEVAGEYSAAYINGTNVDFSRRTAGTWATETAMSDDTFGNFIAMSYGGGEYAIATQDNLAQDLYIGTGSPGSWTGVRVHGNNDGGEGAASSGNNIQIASSATEHVVVHFEIDGSVMAHTKPAGSGTWSAETNLWTANMMSNHMSMAELGSNFYLLWFDPDLGELMLADRDGGWVQANVLAEGVSGIGEFSALTRFNDEWWTPGFNSTPGQRNIHFLNGTTPPWTETLHQDTGHTGEYASMAALDTKLFCIYYRRDVDAWEFGLYDGATWETNWFLLPGIEFSRPVAGGLGDIPFVLYDDTGTGKIVAVTGIPPA